MNVSEKDKIGETKCEHRTRTTTTIDDDNDDDIQLQDKTTTTTTTIGNNNETKALQARTIPKRLVARHISGNIVALATIDIKLLMRSIDSLPDKSATDSLRNKAKDVPVLAQPLHRSTRHRPRHHQ